MTCYTINSRGRYKCNFCDHSTYKTHGGIQTHLQSRHELEMTKALLEENKAEVIKLRSQPPKVEVKERIVYRDPPAKKETKYWYIKNGGGIYCESCKIVQMGVGIPEGQTIESTPHNCGNRTLKLVLEVR
jgi:hypothetical protein